MDNKKHKLPDTHAHYQDFEVIVAIPSGEKLEGDIPSGKMCFFRHG